MAHFETEYQRLEASYGDSPPGEENLLMHVPEGSKSHWHHIENLDLFFQRISFWSFFSFKNLCAVHENTDVHRRIIFNL
ncbi:Autophagy- protein 9A [Ilyodon furcidens]|uniref:Autophagy- protein 9A n=1 Tax=Ilyodon furcidens TaxID=33524 RepID=A0ABV0V4J5_9TELE